MPFGTAQRSHHSRGMRVGAGLILGALLLATGAMVLPFMHGDPHSESLTPSETNHTSNSVAPVPGPMPPTNSALAGPPKAVAASELPLNSTTSPDQFARAFAKGLLTQDFRTSRSSLLAWVQAHSAVSPEPLVMGLIPAPARPTWAVTSVTDSSEGTPAVPDQREWDLLASVSGYQTVDIQRVSEPYPWVAAVAAGRISDPGVTAREIVAVVTRDTLENGQPRTVRSSVVLGINLEGPPTRDTWAFVTLVTYTSIVMPL
jgi:hypothetical protein